MNRVRALAVSFVMLAFGAAATWAGQPPPPPAGGDVAQAINQFAFDLYGQVRERPGNLFLSPYSIETALAMTWTGARGTTADQMAQMLHLSAPRDPQATSAAFAALREALAADAKKGGVELAIANRLWGQKGYEFLPEFLGLLKASYGAGLETVDYERATEAARQTINAWVEKETRDKIKDLLKPDILTPLTRLVLTNAIYFKGEWAARFDKKLTREEDFFAAPGRTVKAPMMNATDEKYPYADCGTYQVLELPYRGEDLSMVILLPKAKDGLAALGKSLSADVLKAALANLRKQKVEVAIPKFKTTAEFSLRPALEALGMTDAFSDKADLSGMDGKKDLCVSAVVHQAFVEVNEEGTEAAAATAVVISRMSVEAAPPVFRADHPFLFLIRHRPSGAILFLGRLVNPTE